VTLRGWVGFLFLILVAGIGFLAWERAEGEAPTIDAPGALTVAASGHDVELTLTDARSGLRSLRVTIRQAGEDTDLVSEEFPGSLIGGAASVEPTRTQRFNIDPKALGLVDGEAVLTVVVSDWSWRGSFRGNTSELVIPVTIDRKKPRVQVLTGLSYIKRGGADAVEYTVSETPVRDGVQVGDEFFPGFPHPNMPGRRFALFAVPTTAPEKASIRVIAEDSAGNIGSGRWSVVLRERVLPKASVSLPQQFLDVTVRDLAEANDLAAEDPQATFRHINTVMRSENEAKIREMTADSSPTPLWEGAFDQLTNSKVTSRFAEQRTYFAGGVNNSEAIHYGYDLASTSMAAVNAANHGRVVFADDLGIYGNCVLVDHGLGLSTLYGHLSQIDVSVGDEVQKGEPLGLSGATGLAGGDHLHFAVQVGGTYVDPLEWWDPSWVRKHIDVRLESSSAE
jgi:murein DD-endopeptidase MepM/ murein hydrolase activator NlpD